MPVPLTLPDGHQPVLGDTFRLYCQVRDSRTGDLVNLTGSKIWLTFKTATSQLDAAAALQVNSTDNPTMFSILSTGVMRITVPGATMATALTAGVTYYVDVKVKRASGDLDRHLYDEVTFLAQVTRATS